MEDDQSLDTKNQSWWFSWNAKFSIVDSLSREQPNNIQYFIW